MLILRLKHEPIDFSVGMCYNEDMVVDIWQVEPGRKDTLNENGDVEPVFPDPLVGEPVSWDKYYDSLNPEEIEAMEQGLEWQEQITDPERESPIESPRDHKVGIQAVKEHMETDPAVDRYPDKDAPPLDVRLALDQMTPEVFDTIRKKDEDKRFVALSIWLLHRGDNLHDYVLKWLRVDRISSSKTRAEFYEKLRKWEPRLERICYRHGKTKGETNAPWVQISKGTVNGKRALRARVNWSEDYSIKMKNWYYDERREVPGDSVVAYRHGLNTNWDTNAGYAHRAMGLDE